MSKLALRLFAKSLKDRSSSTGITITTEKDLLAFLKQEGLPIEAPLESKASQSDEKQIKRIAIRQKKLLDPLQDKLTISAPPQHPIANQTDKTTQEILRQFTTGD